MARKIYISGFFLLAAAMAVLQFFAYKFHWYWHFYWFDTIMHTSGGILVASLALWFFFIIRKKVFEKAMAFAIAFAAISIIGVGWELFEYHFGQFIFFGPHNPVDTAKDLIFDGVGTIIGVLIFLKLYNKLNGKL